MSARPRPQQGGSPPAPRQGEAPPVAAQRSLLSPGLAPLLAIALAIVGGLAWALCFGPRSFVLVPWAALAPLLPLLSRKRTGWLGFLHGFAYWLFAISWIAPTLVTFGGMSRPLSVAMLGVLAGYLALFHAAFAALGAPLWRRGGVWALAGLPALWAALEWLRTYLGGGFPWNLAAYAWVDVAGALPLAAWSGPYGISFLVVLANVGTAASAVRFFRPPAERNGWWIPLAVAWTAPLLLLPLAGRWSTGLERGQAEMLPVLGEPVRLLQPNIANLTGWDAQAVARNYRKVFDLSRPLCEPGALLVWPESAAWPFTFDRDALFAADLRQLAERGGCTILFNSTHEAGEYVFNSAYVLRPDGDRAPMPRYDKRHLVPFGEYVPFRGVFSFVDKLAREAGNFRPADELTLLPWGEERLGMAICYEIIFPDEVAELTQRGATLLTTITNDAWYGDTAAPWQHFRAVRFRAAENRRTLLRSAITGVTALVGPDGSVRAELPLFTEGTIRARVLGRHGLTPYARHPQLVALLLTLAALAALVGVRLGRHPGIIRP